MDFRLPDIPYQGPQLDVPEPPDDLPYARFWDYYNREILRLNGVPLETEALIGLLESPESDPILRAAAAHTAGADRTAAAAPALREALEGNDDVTAVEAAYALARLGDEAGDAALVAAVDRPQGEFELAPLFAAGYLAQCGDPRGFPIVVRTFRRDAPAPRMLACKQLHFFMPFHGRHGPAGDVIDVVGAFQEALAHPDSALHWQALFQLRETSDPAFVELVRRYADRAPDSALASMARSILHRAG